MKPVVFDNWEEIEFDDVNKTRRKLHSTKGEIESNGNKNKATESVYDETVWKYEQFFPRPWKFS